MKKLALLLLFSTLLSAQTYNVPSPGTKIKSYHASSIFAGSSTTDNAVIPGNGTNIVLVTGIYVSCTQTSSGIITLSIVKRSTADSGGTSSSMTTVPDDSAYAAASTTPKTYTGTGPTVGTPVGTLDSYQLGCLATSTSSPNDIYIMPGVQFSPIVLNSATQQVAVNFGGAIGGGQLTVTFTWKEVTVKP